MAAEKTGTKKSNSAYRVRGDYGERVLTRRAHSVGARDRSPTRRESWQEARRRRRRRWRYFLVVVLLCAVIGTSLALKSSEKTAVQLVVTPAVSQPKPAPSEPASAEFDSAKSPGTAHSELAGDPAALKKRVEEIAAYYGGTYGVIISDPSSGEQVTLGSDETFVAASIGKLPTLLSLYKSAARGEVDLNNEISILATDVQSYGTGVLYTYPVGTTMTLRECAYYLMNDSDNTAWSMLTRYLSVDGIQAHLASIGAYDTAYWSPNTTTARDVLLMLKKISDPSFTTPDLSEEMLRSMTDTVFEDRIPSVLPPDVRVAHKIGTYENNFSDAGIVSYKDRDGSEKHYFIVVFTQGMGEKTARAAIQEISTAAYQTFGAPRAAS